MWVILACVLIIVLCTCVMVLAKNIKQRCHFLIGIMGPVWYLIVLIPDLCTLTYVDNDQTSVYFLWGSIWEHLLEDCQPFNSIWKTSIQFKTPVLNVTQ